LRDDKNFRPIDYSFIGWHTRSHPGEEPFGAMSEEIETKLKPIVVPEPKKF
jgi:hypothetical protein